MCASKYILIILGVCGFSFANLEPCPNPEDWLSSKKRTLCLTNDTIYYAPLPINLDVEVYFQNVIKIDEDLNLIRIQANLWTYWSDPGLALEYG